MTDEEVRKEPLEAADGGVVAAAGAGAADDDGGAPKAGAGDTKRHEGLEAGAEKAPAVPVRRIEHLRVSASSPVSRVAGALAQTVRLLGAGDPCPDMLATGSTAIFQCVWAFAVARVFLEGNRVDLDAYPSFRPEKRLGLRLHIGWSPVGEQPSNAGLSPGPASSASESAPVSSSAPSSPSPSQSPSPSPSAEAPETAAEPVPEPRVSSELGPAPGPAASALKVGKNSSSSLVAGAIAARVRAGEPVSLVSVGVDATVHAVHAVAIARVYLQEDGVDLSFRAHAVTIQFQDTRSANGLEIDVRVHQTRSL